MEKSKRVILETTEGEAAHKKKVMTKTEQQMVKVLDDALRKKKTKNYELAEKLGYSSLQIGKWRKGKQTMKLTVFIELCQEAGVESIIIDNLIFRI